MNTNHHPTSWHDIDKSAFWTFIGIAVLFSTAILVTLFAPLYTDPTWIQPTNAYQVQMYEVSDPNFFISSAGIAVGITERQAVHRLQDGYTLLSFEESEFLRIIAPSDLSKYVTRFGEEQLKLTTRLLMLRDPIPSTDIGKQVQPFIDELEKDWSQQHPDSQTVSKPAFHIMELYSPGLHEAFSVSSPETILENWVDANYTILENPNRQFYQDSTGVIYVKNPQEYRIVKYKFGNEEGWRYDPKGNPIANVEELQSHTLAFRSRKQLIQEGEHIYAIEGCWYCHTDQTRTLVQDVVLNGSAEYPAPPSSANEYIYQYITFPGTRRIGPDLSRVGVKRPSRDWHKGHFWSPKTASAGSIMPSFRHFFDNDPRGTSQLTYGIPNHKFEAIFQYLMTKGTRITPPTEAWWLGKDPIKTKEIIEGQRRLPP